MRHTWRWMGVWITAGWLLAAWGCDEGRPRVESSMTEAKVTGKVTSKGKPVTRGTVVFNPANVERKVASRQAPIGPDGSYEITTLIGENTVSAGGVDTITFDVKPGTNALDLN